MKSFYSKYFILLYIPILILLGSTIVISLYSHISISFFFRDPAAIANVHPLAGCISNVGVLLWAFCAAICLFSSLVLYSTEKKELTFFIFYAGVITLVSMLDDLFMIHESLGPKYLHINEKIFYGIYLLTIFLFLIKFIKTIFSSRFILLVVSLLCFVSSVFFDVLPINFKVTGNIFFEDGFKLLGITGWFGYFVSLCFYEVISNVHFNEKHKVD